MGTFHGSIKDGLVAGHNQPLWIVNWNCRSALTVQTRRSQLFRNVSIFAYLFLFIVAGSVAQKRADSLFYLILSIA